MSTVFLWGVLTPHNDKRTLLSDCLSLLPAFVTSVSDEYQMELGQFFNFKKNIATFHSRKTSGIWSPTDVTKQTIVGLKNVGTLYNYLWTLWQVTQN